MSAQAVVIPKRRFFAGKMLWLFGGCVAVIVIGTVIQMRMTWSREQMRGITSEANDAIAAAKVGASQIRPSENPFAPLLEMFQTTNNESISQ
jgi:hypothetical protein